MELVDTQVDRASADEEGVVFVVVRVSDGFLVRLSLSIAHALQGEGEASDRAFTVLVCSLRDTVDEINVIGCDGAIAARFLTGWALVGIVLIREFWPCSSLEGKTRAALSADLDTIDGALDDGRKCG